MPPTGPDDRKDDARRGEHSEELESIALPTAPAAAPHEDDPAPPREAGRNGLPPGIGAQSPPEMFRPPDAAAAYPPGYGDAARRDVSERADAGKRPSPSAPRYDRFGWPIPDENEADPRDRRPAAPRGPYSGQFPAQEPAPNQSPRGPYSGQFPTQPPRPSGAFPVIPPEQTSRSGAWPISPPPDATRSGQFPAPPANPAYQSGAYAVPPETGTREYAVTASGPIPQSPYISGPMPRVGEQPGAVRQSGPLAYPGEVTSTGSRRVIVAPDAGIGSLLADPSALAFLLAAVVLAGAMIAYIALRYAHFPNQIALHFGPAGSSEPTRIGEKRELWTVPFIVGIVLTANTALAWAVYHYDRFAARLLTLGCALVAAIAWVVLLTLLHR